MSRAQTVGWISNLRAYYQLFKPTLEKPAEWKHVEKLLVDDVTQWKPLAAWISELHIFTPYARTTLLANIADRSRSRPVLLVVMSELDWNTAFLQGAELERAIVNPSNLGLVVQGRTLGGVTAQVARVARDFGKGGKIGQVVVAGHGSDTTMQMSSDSSAAWWDPENNHVTYNNQSNLDSKNDPKRNGTEALIDTILSSLDPATANVVFAGCLINSHDIDPTKSNLTGKVADVEKQLRENIKAHPNLADYVKARMVATGHTATLSAANASTPFASFKVDRAGKAQLKDQDDPDIGGTKLQYLRTGAEPEGVLRAAVEACATVGIVPTTAEIRARVAALSATRDYGLTCIRVGLGLALPPTAAGTVDVAKLADVVHRIGVWSEFSPAVRGQRLADAVHKDEAKAVFDSLLGASQDVDVDVGIHQAWMKHDPAHASQMMAKLSTSRFTVETFTLQLSPDLVRPHLATMLRIGGVPTRGQMILALTIADVEGERMPSHVRDFLRAAAGGATSRSFPAALGVEVLFPNGGPRILELIGLSDKAPAPVTGTIEGNVDLDGDSTNETRVTSAPRPAKVLVDAVTVRATATSSAKEIGRATKGTFVRVVGTVREGTWSMIDFHGRIGFVATQHLGQE